MVPAKATLEVTTGKNKGLKVVVQFNPQSLRVDYHTTGAGGSQSGSADAGKQTNTRQPTSYRASLSMELLFDTSQTGQDVRNTTLKIAKMMEPPNAGEAPIVNFQWGTFLFTGSIQSMNETLDLFSEQGVPLRATVSLSMAGDKLDELEANKGIGLSFSVSASASFSAGVGGGLSAGASFSTGAAVGTTPLTLSQSGDTLQGLVGRAGIDASWKTIASANNIDNPRLMEPGTVLNMNARASASAELK